MRTILAVAVVTALAVAMTLARPSSARAAEVQLGAVGMVDWWNPVFKMLHTGETTKLIGFEMGSDISPSFMLGPTLGVKFSSWNMTLTPLFGVSRNEFSSSSFVWDVPLLALPFESYLQINESKARRYDVDLKFAKSIHKFFNITIGARFNYGDGEGQNLRLGWSGPGINFGKDEYSVWQLGPSFGLGFNYEIKGFTVYANAAFLLTFGENYLERKLFFGGLFPIIRWVIPNKYDTYFLGFGLDTEAGVAYFIAPARVTVGVGFRWVGTVAANLDDSGQTLDLSYNKGWIGGEWDHFYGLIFKVTYKF